MIKAPPSFSFPSYLSLSLIRFLYLQLDPQAPSGVGL